MYIIVHLQTTNIKQQYEKALHTVGATLTMDHSWDWINQTFSIQFSPNYKWKRVTYAGGNKMNFCNIHLIPPLHEKF